ncbi:MAG: guanitoxin biosynthesis MBL fold metallo-hydrolase GntH [Proteobacteria bacterium]|nr:guanitoxin biosynthesis MBL fold metallo-hydrolase GntH [Pseudomonadota bacterium]
MKTWIGLSAAFVSGAVLTVALVAPDPVDIVASANAEQRSKKHELDVYYPGTEEIGADEMRVVACGTGMPSPRPKQAAACWLVELGNGDKFLFDLGAGSHERIAAQKIPYDYLDKVFIGHLHVDHFGDLASFWLGGTTLNRLTPLRIWGPSGATPEMGTAHAMKKMQELYVWDIATRSGFIDPRGMALEIHEFDYKGVNKVIFEENGVKIRTIPAIHAIDGAVSFILEWNGLKFTYSSDTYPNKWWLEHTKNSDISIHESLLPPSLLISKQGFAPQEALQVGTVAHTSPAQFGKVMSLTKPRMAVGYHFQNDFDTLPLMISEARKTYDGPMVFAQDYMVFNVTKEEVKVRMSAYDEDIYPEPPTRPKEAPPGDSLTFSKFILSGAEPFPEVVQPMWDEINEAWGTDLKPPQ